MPCACVTTAVGPKTPTRCGSSGTSCSMGCGTRRSLEPATFRPFCRGSPPIGTSAHLPKTRRSAPCLFLYRAVLGQTVGAVEGIVRARTPPRLPVVLTRAEVAAVLGHLQGTPALVVGLLYGSGLRLLEALDLRVKDIDLERGEITIRQGKGRKDRVAPLPRRVATRLPAHLEMVRRQHDRDVELGCGAVCLPDALVRKYPNASIEWPWQFVFPAARICRNPRWGPPGRFHLHESAIQRAVADAARRQESRSGRRATRSVTRSPPTFSRTGTTFERCRNYSVTPTSAPP